MSRNSLIEFELDRRLAHKGLFSYNCLIDRPSINSRELVGHLSLSDLGIQPSLVAGYGVSIDRNTNTISVSVDPSGISDYIQLSNKPLINGVTLIGNLNGTDLGLADVSFVTDQIAEAISGITQFDYEIVESLPATGKKGTLYLTEKTSTVLGDFYNEYLYINNSWELIGNTAIDVSGKLDKVTTGDSKRTYIVTAANTQSMMGISGNGESLLTEHQDISGKLDAITTPTGSSQPYRIYAVKADGTQTFVKVPRTTDSTSTSAILMTRSGGRLGVGTPTDNDDATTKLYVDTAISNIDLSGKLDKVITGDSKRAYIIASDNTQAMMSISGSGSSLLTEHQDISGKLDKSLGSPAYTQIYGVSSTSVQTMYNLDKTNGSNRTSSGVIVRRIDNYGNLWAANKENITDPNYVASKDYVDSGLSGKQNALTAGTNISITDDVISATDTTYTAGADINISSSDVISTKYVSGQNVAFTNVDNTIVVSAIDTTYSAGSNISIDSTTHVISATDTTYTGDGTTVTIDSNNVISATADVSGKLDKVTSTLTDAIPRLYSIESDGTQSVIQTGSQSGLNRSVANTIPIRVSNGNIYLPNSSYISNDNYAASKKYVDDAISTVDMSSKLDKITTGDSKRAYVVLADNTQSAMTISGSGSSLLTEHQDISGKLDKVTSSNNNVRVYSIAADGSQSTLSVDRSTGDDRSTSGVVVSRSTDGNIYLPDKTSISNDNYATSKKYVDDLVSSIPSLPSVSSADNGKIMSVVNGAWSAISIENADSIQY